MWLCTGILHKHIGYFSKSKNRFGKNYFYCPRFSIYFCTWATFSFGFCLYLVFCARLWIFMSMWVHSEEIFSTVVATASKFMQLALSLHTFFFILCSCSLFFVLFFVLCVRFFAFYFSLLRCHFAHLGLISCVLRPICYLMPLPLLCTHPIAFILFLRIITTGTWDSIRFAGFEKSLTSGPSGVIWSPRFLGSVLRRLSPLFGMPNEAQIMYMFGRTHLPSHGDC